MAAQKLREWHIEILSWDWPRGEDVKLGKGFIPPTKRVDNTSRKLGESPSATRDDFVDEYLGSLPASIVERYESRIDEIKDGMDALDVDELKEHVLNAHISSRSRPSSSNSAVCTVPQRLSYVQLSDFTAVITATILQALPWLSRLNIILNTWDVRLVVLWQIPGLLESLKAARTAIDASLESLNSQAPPSENDALFSQSSFRAARQNLEHLVVLAGSKIDRILDSLEGREDSLPETWIDDMESIEADFGNWVVEAEKLATRNELSRMNIPSNNIQTPPQDESKMPDSDNQPEIESSTSHELAKSVSSSNPITPATEQGLSAIQDVSNPQPPKEPISPAISISSDTVDSRQVRDKEVPQFSVSQQSGDIAPKDARADLEDEYVSQIEPDMADGESVPSTDDSSSSHAHPNPSSVSEESIVGGNPIPEAPMQSRIESDDIQPTQDSHSDPINITTAHGEPELHEANLNSPSSILLHSKVESPGIQSSQTESDPQSPKLDKSSVNILEGSDFGSYDETTNQLDDQPFENNIPLVGSLAGSPHTVVTTDLRRAPSSNEEHRKTVPDTTVGPPIGFSAQPSPEINVTAFSSPAQSDDGDVSPRNTSFSGRRDSSASPTNVLGPTTRAAPFSFKNSQLPPKKLKHKPGPLDLASINAKSHRRNISGDSLVSDCASAASSPEIKDAQTATSHGSPMVVEATARWTQSKYSPAKPSRTHSAQTLQGPGLYRRTTEPPSSAESLELNRTTSLPLQRFINDDFYPVHGRKDSHEAIRPAEIKRASVTSIKVQPKTEVSTIFPISSTYGNDFRSSTNIS